LRRRIQDGSASGEDYQELGSELLAEQGNIQEAIELYRRGIEVVVSSQDKAALWVELGFLLHETWNADEAPHCAHRAMELSTPDATSPRALVVQGFAHALLAYCLWDTDAERSAEAARTALRLLDAVPKSGREPEETWVELLEAARLCNWLGRSSDAIERCQIALGLVSKPLHRLECLIELGEALRSAGRFAEAARVLEEGLGLTAEASMHAPKLYFQLGLVHRALGRATEALEAFSKSLQEAERRPTLHASVQSLTGPHWQRAELYYEAEEYARARAEFEAVVALHPGDDEFRRFALGWMGNCYRGLGMYEKARAAYREVLASPLATTSERAVASGELAALAKLL
jgi:tetratricopeptide (TPR) repeat protein